MPGVEQKPRIDRTHGNTPFGRFAFWLFRLGSAYLLYRLLLGGWIDSVFAALNWPVPAYRGPNYSLKALILTILFTVGAVRQGFWASVLAPYRFPVQTAVAVALFNLVNDALVAICAARSTDGMSAAAWAGVALFVLGSVLETGSELQRWWFKRSPRNAGRPYTGGLFSLAHSINYFGYTLWRSGLALLSSNIVPFLLVAMVVMDFVRTQIPTLMAHNRAKYGAEYEAYCARVPKLVPFLY